MPERLKSLEELMDSPDSKEPAVKVILPYDKNGNIRRIILENQDLPANLGFNACFLDFSTKQIKIYLNPDIRLTLSLKGTHRFESVPAIKQLD